MGWRLGSSAEIGGVAKVAGLGFAFVAAIGALVTATSGSTVGAVFAAIGVLGAVVALALGVLLFRAEREDARRTRNYDEPQRVDEALAGEGMYNLGVAPEAPEALETVGLRNKRHAPYLPRPADGELRERLSAAAADVSVSLIVVEGPPAAGKSRTLLEALSEVLPQALLIHPTTPEALLGLAADGPPARRKKGACVLWLNDLERFAGYGDKRLNVRTLRLFNEWKRPVLIVAAFGGKLQRQSDPEGGSEAEDLLRRFPPLVLESGSSPAERRLINEHPEYSRAAARIAAEGIGAFMIVASKLRRRLTLDRDCPEGVAVAQAAIDWQRLGLLRPIPEPLLEELSAPYLKGPATTERFHRGLTWATTTVYSNVALVQDVDQGYEPHDYAVDVERERGRPIPTTTWRAVIDRHAAPDETRWILFAEGRSNPAIAEAAYRRLDRAGEASASYALARLLSDRGDRAGAEQAYARGAEHGHADAAVRLGLLLQHRKEYDGAETAFKRAIELGAPDGELSLEVLHREVAEHRAVEMHNLGASRYRERDLAGAEDAFRRAAELGRYESALALADLREARGDHAGAEEAKRQAAQIHGRLRDQGKWP
jgi:hypothetical protein